MRYILSLWELWLPCLLVFGTLELAKGSNSVTLAWDPSPGNSISSYRIYYGPATGVYTNSVDAGNVTNTTVNGLVSGATYFFAATAMDTSGLESEFSNEVSYRVPIVIGDVPVTIQITREYVLLTARATRALAAYDVLSSPDLCTWRRVATVTGSVDNLLEFVDSASRTNQAAFYRLQLLP